MGNLLKFYENSERYSGKVNMSVIKFIDEVTDFPDRQGNVGEHIDHLFCAGYCYYFANMLKLAFGGKVCWVEDRSHIVWADCDENCSWEELQNATVYDITGIFDDYERIWPVEYLGDTIVSFMHNGKEFHLSESFKDWCEFLHVTENYAIDVIWETMPLDEIMKAYRDDQDMVQTACQYWYKCMNELRTVVRFCKNSNGYFEPRHKA